MPWNLEYFNPRDPWITACVYCDTPSDVEICPACETAIRQTQERRTHEWSSTQPGATTMERTSYYTEDNTQGYTQAEIDALNAALCALLAPLYAGDGCPDLDTVNAMITRHNDEVARRERSNACRNAS